MPAVNRRAVNRRAMVEVIREPWRMAVVAAVVAAVAVAERARGQWRSHGFRYTHWRDSNGFVLSPTSPFDYTRYDLLTDHSICAMLA